MRRHAQPLDGNIGIPCPWPCRDRRRPAPAQLRRLDAALSACGGCQPGSGGPRWSPSRPCPPVHPATSPRLSAARTIAAPSGCSLWHCRLDGDDAGLAFGQRAGFVDQKRVARSSRSRASAFLISTPDCAPRPTATMMDIGVAGPSMQGGKSGRGTARSYRPVRGACPRQRQCHRAKAQDGGPDGCAEPRRTLAKPGPAGTNCRPYR